MSLAHCRRMGWYGRAVNSGDAPPPVFHGFGFFFLFCACVHFPARETEKKEEVSEEKRKGGTKDKATTYILLRSPPPPSRRPIHSSFPSL